LKSDRERLLDISEAIERVQRYADRVELNQPSTAPLFQPIPVLFE
jgi:uncharacterized protein with HEPN domain